MVAKYQQFATMLREQGNSITGPRKLVFEKLCEAHPVSMAELVELCAHTVDRASVYRAIALFENLHIVKRVYIGWKYKLELSDRFSHHHHHLTCTVCGAIKAIPEDSELENRLTIIALGEGFSSTEHQVEITGICNACGHNLKDPSGDARIV